MLRLTLNPPGMRHWLFHPLLFFPLVLALAVLVAGASLKPQLLPRPAAAVAGRADGPTLLLQGDAFNAPVDPPEQYVTVVRDLLGRPQSLRIAVLPRLRPPSSAERGVQILLTPETARLLANRRVRAEVTYRPLAVNAAPSLALAAEGSEPVHWVRRQIPPLAGIVQYDLTTPDDLHSIGLRAINTDPNLAFGVEIVSIRLSPR